MGRKDDDDDDEREHLTSRIEYGAEVFDAKIRKKAERIRKYRMSNGANINIKSFLICLLFQTFDIN